MKIKNNISLLVAILININIIVGAGIFLNIQPLVQLTGAMSFLSYALSALILFPFVYTLARLAQNHPIAGGLYVYSKTYLHLFAGFISGWSYFIGKTVSVAFLASVFTSFFQQKILFLQSYPLIPLTILVIFSLAILNILGAHIGGKIQFFFFATKAIPLLFVIIIGLMLPTSTNYIVITKPLLSLVATIPIALYSLMGFEITCAISHLIKKPTTNIFYAIIGSFLIVVTVYLLFQYIIYNALGAKIFSSSEPLALLAHTFFISYPIIEQIITTLVFTSVIAGAFGILTSNCWNLHALATDNHFPGKKFFCKITKTNVPWGSLLFESGLASLIIIISKNQIALQSMSVFGVVLAFLLNSFAAFKARIFLQLNPLIPTCAIASCCYILFLCFQKIIAASVSIPYIILISTGIGFSLIKNYLSKVNF